MLAEKQHATLRKRIRNEIFRTKHSAKFEWRENNFDA